MIKTINQACLEEACDQAVMAQAPSKAPKPAPLITRALAWRCLGAGAA